MGRISDYYASQCGNPHGIIGRILTWLMNRANKIMYNGIVSELSISEKSKVLDIGFGNGYLEKLIMQKRKCHITGIDISDDMVKKATLMNQEYVDSGNIKFQLGDCCSLDFADGTFDAAATINTIYFWNDTAKGMSEIYRVLKKGGTFCNAVISKQSLDKMLLTQSGFKKFSKKDYIELGKKAGFRKVQIKKLDKRSRLIIICTK